MIASLSCRDAAPPVATATDDEAGALPLGAGAREGEGTASLVTIPEDDDMVALLIVAEDDIPPTVAVLEPVGSGSPLMDVTAPQTRKLSPMSQQSG